MIESERDTLLLTFNCPLVFHLIGCEIGNDTNSEKIPGKCLQRFEPRTVLQGNCDDNARVLGREMKTTPAHDQSDQSDRNRKKRLWVIGPIPGPRDIPLVISIRLQLFASTVKVCLATS